MLTGVSRMDSIFSWSNARARAAGSPAAKSSRRRRAREAIRSRRARSVMTMKSHGCEKPTLGAWCAAVSTRPSTSAGTGSGRKPRRTSRRSAITRYTASRCSGENPGAWPSAAAAAAPATGSVMSVGMIVRVVVRVLGLADVMLEARHRDPVHAHIAVHPDVSGQRLVVALVDQGGDLVAVAERSEEHTSE